MIEPDYLDRRASTPVADQRALSEVGEHAFLRALCADLRERRAGRGREERSLLVEPGDDCAVLAQSPYPLALTTDSLVEGVHFRPDWLTPAELGRRAAMVSLSDLAAMGATPTALLVAAALPVHTPVERLEAILGGCAAASAELGAVLAGGNLARADVLSLAVTAVGELRGPCLTRSGAEPGDLLVVSGTLGDAAAAVAEWLAGREPAPALRTRWVAPLARIDVARALAAAGAHAAIDLSDGLAADLGHLCCASSVGAVVDLARLPKSPAVAALDADGADFALEGGEDYELLCAVPVELEDQLPEIERSTGVPLRTIGRVVPAEEGLTLVDEQGRRRPIDRAGYDHFTARTGAR